MPDASVQLVTNPGSFENRRLPASGGGSGKDFFADRDLDFVVHRREIARSMRRILHHSENDELVAILVKMRPDALAKTHRPFSRLFPPSLAVHVGTVGYGELILLSDRARLTRVLERIAAAEDSVAWRTDANGRSQPNPSAARCETGAIAEVQRWEPSVERGFSVDEAAEWLSSGGNLAVETFQLSPTERYFRHPFSNSRRRLLDSVRPFGRLRIVSGSARALSELTSPWNAETPEFDTSTLALAMSAAESSPVVRRLHLEEKLDVPDSDAVGDPISTETGEGPEQPPSTERGIVGVIDGGCIGPIKSFLIEQSLFVSPVHQSVKTADHASRVASLIRLGSSFNPGVLSESGDCDVYDIGLFPDPANIEIYFDGLDSLMEQLRSEVVRARNEFGVRIFNMSWNLRRPPGAAEYGLAARALDDIATDLGVVFVVSAGNLPESEVRPEWPADELDALGVIAGSAGSDGLMGPAESIANLAIGAVNAPEVDGALEGAPTAYTRRSLPVPSVAKPNFAAVSGSRSRAGVSGLRAMSGSGNVTGVLGTSFAAPVFARYLASLEHELGQLASTELLIALSVHHAELPPPLQGDRLRGLAPSFVGHGMASSVDETLTASPHAFTLVLEDVLLPRKRTELPIVWPESLVSSTGKCRGKVRMTLVTQPILDHAHGAEFVRVNLDASLRQSENGRYATRTEPMHEFFSGYRYAQERTLATLLGKWFPIKSYTARMPRGRGSSRDWRLEVDYLTRAGVEFPDDGVRYCAVLTIEDIDKKAPVFDELTRSLAAIGVRTQDVKTALRVQV